MKTAYNIIIKPIQTEKSMAMAMPEKAGSNKALIYTFKVDREANKYAIKAAVEEIFKVKVDSVRTVRVKGKPKTTQRNRGQRSDWKKALVVLKEGQRLDII
ncbi:MAG: 50S ribosomal protein L23 [Candidatus Brocadiia bacterium]